MRQFGWAQLLQPEWRLAEMPQPGVEPISACAGNGDQKMKSPRIALALVSVILLSPGFAGSAFAKGTGVSREPSRLFEGVPRTSLEKSSERRAGPFARTPQKSGCCAGLFDFPCN
jgi:hypothetical protein